MAETSTDGAEVVDNPEEGRFVLRQDGHEAELTYRARGGRLVLVHTGVPEELGGRGVGGRLVRAAIERAAREQLTVVPVCPFAADWLRRHPDVASTLSVDWPEPAAEG